MITDRHGNSYPSVAEALAEVRKYDRCWESPLLAKEAIVKLRADIDAILASYHGATASLDRVAAELPFASVPVGLMRAELVGEAA